MGDTLITAYKNAAIKNTATSTIDTVTTTSANTLIASLASILEYDDLQTNPSSDAYDKYDFKDTDNYQKDNDDDVLELLGDYESEDLAFDDTDAFELKFNDVDIAKAVDDANTTVGNLQGYYLTEVKKA